MERSERTARARGVVFQVRKLKDFACLFGLTSSLPARSCLNRGSSRMTSQAGARHFRKCESNALRWFGTSMNWMQLAPNTGPMPTIVVVAVETAEMQYDSIETSEIS